jgi:hypothetical protein
LTQPANGALTLRPGTLEDSRTVFDIFLDAIQDLSRRQGAVAITGGRDPEVLAALWDSRRPLLEHLAGTAEHFWIAEQDGEAIGYARSTLRTGVRQLTEFFVRPGRQSAGAGKGLLARAFPADGAARRVLIGTTDERAQALYLRAGVYPVCPCYYFSHEAKAETVPTDLAFEPIAESGETLARLAAVDIAVLGYRRDIDHAFLLGERQGYLYRRGGTVAGYGYTGERNGPFALLEAGDYAAVLAHAEAVAAAAGREFGVEVPLANRAALQHLIERRFQMEAFFAFLMTDGAPGRPENYILTSPPFIL